jgi:hypothetical protein
MRGRLTGPAAEVHAKATAAAVLSLLALGILCGGAAGSAGDVSGLRGAAAPRSRCAFPACGARPCGVLRLRGGQAGDGGGERGEGMRGSRSGATDGGSTNTTTSGTGVRVWSARHPCICAAEAGPDDGGRSSAVAGVEQRIFKLTQSLRYHSIPESVARNATPQGLTQHPRRVRMPAARLCVCVCVHALLRGARPFQQTGARKRGGRRRLALLCRKSWGGGAGRRASGGARSACCLQ